MSRGYVDVRRGYLEKHLLPYFAEVKLSSINAKMIEDWITELRKKEAERGGLLSATTKAPNYCSIRGGCIPCMGSIMTILDEFCAVARFDELSLLLVGRKTFSADRG